jgi:ABC-type antimicrobial peptide transport system permease subunit
MIKSAIVILLFLAMLSMPAALIAIIIDTIKDSEPDFDID